MPRSYSTAQKLLPLLLDNLEDYALFMMDVSGCIVTWTPGVERLMGYAEAEFLEQNAAIIFTPRDCEAGLPDQERERARKTGRSEDVRWHKRKDGTLFWANGQMIALRDESGELRGFAKLLRDETRHKRIEDDLRRMRRQLQTALDVGRIGTWAWDIQHNRVEADTNLARFFGLSAEEAHGGPVERYFAGIHPDDAPRVSNVINEALQSGAVFSDEYRLVPNEGEVLWIEARGQAELDASGRPLHFNGVMLDITERKHAEALMRQSEERYRTLFEAIDNGFCVIEMIFDGAHNPVDYRFIEINPAFEKQTGLQNAVGKTMREFAPRHEDFWFQTYGRVVTTGEAVHFENFAETLDRWFEVHAFRVEPPQDHRLAVLFSDISARKKGELALRQAHAHSEETNRMKDEFFATLSHELRTPLNAILGWANILRTNQLDAATQTQGLETIERNARAQSKLINDLLDVSRILTGKLRLDLRPLELAGVLEDALNTVRPTSQAKSITIETSIDQTTGLISGDRDRLNQVFWNLLTNAIKFTPRGGHIRVEMRRADSGVEVSVSDSGRGIAPDFLPFVFERFRQADASSTRAFGGLGIGLALVRHLMEAHGGTVRASSRGENMGATFSVTFPLSAVRPRAEKPVVAVPSRETALPQPQNSPQQTALSGLRILVVDDENDARFLVQLALSQHGAQVVTAESVAAAFALAVQSRSSDAPFDVLVSDVGMPGEDGFSLIRRIRGLEERDGSFLPAIALTAYADAKNRINALLAGFQVHLAKPVDPMELVATVASLKGRTGHDG